MTNKATIETHKRSQRLGKLQIRLKHHARDAEKAQAVLERCQEAVRVTEAEIVQLCPHNLVADMERSGFRMVRCTNCTFVTWESGVVHVQKAKT